MQLQVSPKIPTQENNDKWRLVANGNYTSIATTIFSGTTTLSGSADIKFGSVNITGTLNDAGKHFPFAATDKIRTFTTTGTTLFDSTLAQSVGASNLKIFINKPSARYAHGDSDSFK